jgi:glycine hydroxymethyltransferase
VLFDAAHLCGLIAGGVWPNPLDQGVHLISMSTYKSLGGPPGGLLLANDAELAQRIEAIAYPGPTANFDAGKTAALAQTMLDWTVAGPAYTGAMVDTARALVDRLVAAGLPVFRSIEGVTGSQSSLLKPRASAAARLRQPDCAEPTCSLAGLDCRSPRSPATSTDCDSARPRSPVWE